MHRDSPLPLCRQGPPLADNLRCLLTGRPLAPFLPQSTFLSIVSAGGRYAVGSKGWATFEGGWAWWLKDRIDKAFMAKYGSDLPFGRMQVGARAPREGGGQLLVAPASSLNRARRLLP